MDEIKELIIAIQIIAGTGGMVRATYWILMGLNEEDYSPYKKKIKNVIIAVVLIETVFTLTGVFLGYYNYK